MSLTNDGFYLIFDDLFSRAEGRWVVHAPYSAFGDSCLLNEFKDAYGFFSVPVGWSYIYNERNLLSNFIIKFPAIKDENGYVINARMLNDTDTLIELPLELPEKLRSGEKNPYVNSYVLIQRNTIHYDSSLDGIGTEISAPFAPTQSSQLESELSSHLKSETCMIDGQKYIIEDVHNVKRVFTKNPLDRKITKKWSFQSLKNDISITFYVDFDYYSDELRLNHREDLIDMEQQIYFQINEIFKTFSHTS